MYRSSVAPNRSLLIVAFRGKLFANHRANGQRAWRTQIDTPNVDTPIELAIGEHVIVACSPNTLTFVEYATGRVLASIPRTDGGRPTMLIDGDQLLVGTPGVVNCYRLDGQLLWRDGFTGEGYGIVTLGFPGNVRQADG